VRASLARFAAAVAPWAFWVPVKFPAVGISRVMPLVENFRFPEIRKSPIVASFAATPIMPPLTDAPRLPRALWWRSLRVRGSLVRFAGWLVLGSRVLLNRLEWPAIIVCPKS
jgi:hypothetical protein